MKSFGVSVLPCFSLCPCALPGRSVLLWGLGWRRLPWFCAKLERVV